MYKNLDCTIKEGLGPALAIFQILSTDGDLGYGPLWEGSMAQYIQIYIESTASRDYIESIESIDSLESTESIDSIRFL